MKFLVLLPLLLSAFSAYAGSWISTEPDHLSMIYRSGDQAKFLIHTLNEPTKPGYSIQVSVEYVGQATAVDVPLTSGVGEYTTPALPAGTSLFRFVARLVGPNPNDPNDPPFNQVMQDETLAVEGI